VIKTAATNRSLPWPPHSCRTAIAAASTLNPSAATTKQKVSV
jgi:hypothetical protein